jgi:DNA-binding GntR family transcriptional regulator
MVETQLAKQINTSRTPVREALHMLEMEGLLEAIPRVGYRVKQIEWDEIEEICEIRTVNETLAARWAMNRITPKEIQALEENLAVAETEIRHGNPMSFVERDAEFHEILVRASGSKRLLELCQLLRRHMLRYRIEALYLPETGLEAIEEHRRIVDCLRSKDEEGVAVAIRDHLEKSKREIHHHGFGKETELKEKQI